jgi:hypothetical protein
VDGDKDRKEKWEEHAVQNVKPQEGWWANLCASEQNKPDIIIWSHA